MKPVIPQLLDGPGGNYENAGQSHTETNETEFYMILKTCKMFEGSNKLMPEYKSGFPFLHGAIFNTNKILLIFK